MGSHLRSVAVLALCLIVSLSIPTAPASMPEGGCPAAPNTITVPAFTVPAGAVQTFLEDTVLRAASVEILGELRTADAAPGQDAPSLCIETGNLTLSSRAVLCTGDGAAGPVGYNARSASGGAGTDGGDLELHLVGGTVATPVQVHLAPDAILCTGDGGDGGPGVVVPSCEGVFGNFRDSPCDPPTCEEAVQQTDAWDRLCDPCQGQPTDGAATLLACLPPVCQDATCVPSCQDAASGLPILVQMLNPCAPACPPLPPGVGPTSVQPCDVLACLGDGGDGVAYGGRGGDAGRFTTQGAMPGAVQLGAGGRGGDALAFTSRLDGAHAWGGDGGNSFATTALLGILTASQGGDGGDAVAHANTCIVPCVPQDLNLACLLDATYDACDTVKRPPPRDERLCSDTVDEMLEAFSGSPSYGEEGKSVTARPIAPGTGTGGYNGPDGSYSTDYSWGIGVDAKGTVGVSASVSCTSANTPGGRGGDGSGGGIATAGAAGGGRGGFGFVVGGNGGAATLYGANGGKGGDGGNGGDALIEPSLPCGIETAPAGPGGDGGGGGASGSGKAVGGEGGPSYVQPGKGGDANGYAGNAGKGGKGGNGGAGDSMTYCYWLFGVICTDYEEPAGAWGCGGLNGEGKGVRILGGAGGVSNATQQCTGLFGQPVQESEVPGDSEGGQPADHGDGSSRDPPCVLPTTNTVDPVPLTRDAQGKLYAILVPGDSLDDE